MDMTETKVVSEKQTAQPAQAEDDQDLDVGGDGTSGTSGTAV